MLLYNSNCGGSTIEKLEEFSNAFPEFKQALEDESYEEKDEEVVFYLWDTLKDIFDIFKIVRLYLNEYYIVDSGILLALINEKGCSPSYILERMPAMMASYLEVVVTPPSQDFTDG